MRNGRKFGLLIAVLVLVGAVAVPAFAASQKGTYGDLVVKIADAKGLRATDSTTAEAALRQAGYDLPRIDRSKTLTEGDVAAIANSVGLRVATSNPTSAFTGSQVDRFLTSMGSQITATRSSVSAGSISSNDRAGSVDTLSGSGSGKGKKKPHSKSPKKPKKPKPPKPPKTGANHGHHH